MEEGCALCHLSTLTCSYIGTYYKQIAELHSNLLVFPKLPSPPFEMFSPKGWKQTFQTLTAVWRAKLSKLRWNTSGSSRFQSQRCWDLIPIQHHCAYALGLKFRHTVFMASCLMSKSNSSVRAVDWRNLK